MTRWMKFARSHWPSLALTIFVIAISLFGFARGPAEPQTKHPAGWDYVPETGQTFALIVDHDVIWAGGKDGVFKIDRKSGRLIEHVPLGNEVGLVRALTVDTDGSLWIGHTNGLTHLVGTQSTTFSGRDGLPGLRVNALMFDGKSVWVGTANGLATIVDGKPMISPLTAKLISPIVNVLFEDSDDNLWVGSSSTPNGGVTVLGRNQTTRLTIKNGLAHPYVQGIAADFGGSVWVATGQYDEGGVSIFAKLTGGWKVQQVLHKKTGLAGEKARSIAVDRHGNLWIGSESDGLSIKHGESATVLTMADGLPHNEVTCIRGDQDGNVWLATLRGVVRIRQTAIPALTQGKPQGKGNERVVPRH